MDFTVEADITTRVIRIRIEPGSVPDLDVAPHWIKTARMIRPDSAVLELRDGRQKEIQVSGKLVLKNGRTSPGSNATRYDQRWSAPEVYIGEKIADAPDWVRDLWTNVPTHEGN